MEPLCAYYGPRCITPIEAAIARGEMEQHARKRHIEQGYSYVYTPHITKKDLFVTSNHLVTYGEGMWPPIHMDEERDEAGNYRRSIVKVTNPSRYGLTVGDYIAYFAGQPELKVIVVYVESISDIERFKAALAKP